MPPTPNSAANDSSQPECFEGGSGVSRRNFLRTGAGALALTSIAPVLAAQNDNSPPPVAKRQIRKAIMWATVGIKGPILDVMKAVKAAGFEGVEMMSHMKQDQVLHAQDETGLVIPSVCGRDHWSKPLTHPDPKIRAEGLEALRQTLRDAKRYGATSVLLVPGMVNKDVSYPDAYTRSQEEIRKALPLAEELGVKIAVENVWNNFLLSPREAARYIDEFKSPAIGWHFDVGNIIHYGWPEHWIPILGSRILKLHIKEFSRKKSETQGLWKGFNVPFLEGDNDWPEIMKALDKVGYKGWGMAEQGGGDSPEGLQKLSDGMTKIFAS